MCKNCSNVDTLTEICNGAYRNTICVIFARFNFDVS